MSHFVVLTSNPAEKAIASTLVEETALSLGVKAGAPRTLSEGVAVDMAVEGLSLETFRKRIAHLADAHPVDFNLVAARARRKKLLIADMDSTIITAECIDELADFAGLKDKISAITERAMRGELEFESALRERVALLGGLETTVLPRVFEERIQLTPGAKTLVATMKKNGAFAALISGGFTFFTGRVAEVAGFDFQQANILLEDNGHLTGKVEEPILGREAKREALLRFRTDKGLDADETLAVGDGANDLAMIHEAGLGVAFRAKPVVAEAAAASVTHGDLTALLYLQGYADEDILWD